MADVREGKRAKSAAPPATGSGEVRATGTGEVRGLDTLKADPRNARRRTARGRALLKESFEKIGAGRSILVDESDQIIAGHGAVQGAIDAGLTRVRIIDVERDEVVAVRRRDLTPEEKRFAAIADNRTAELAEWIPEELPLDDLALKPFFTPAELQRLSLTSAASEVREMAAAPVPSTSPTREAATSAQAAETASDYQTFSCPLTTDQERAVREVLRLARRVFQVKTAGAALAAVLQAWAKTQDASGQASPSASAN